jgi:hypothetical protein
LSKKCTHGLSFPNLYVFSEEKGKWTMVWAKQDRYNLDCGRKLQYITSSSQATDMKISKHRRFWPVNEKDRVVASRSYGTGWILDADEENKPIACSKHSEQLTSPNSRARVLWVHSTLRIICEVIIHIFLSSD